MVRRLAVLTLLVSTIGGGIYGWRIWSAARRPTREDLQRVAVRRVDFDVNLTAGGLVESSNRTQIECQVENLSSFIEGRAWIGGASSILEVVDEGTQVKTGDVLCRLDTSDFEELVRQQEILVQQARSDFEKAQLDVKALQIGLEEYRDGLLPQELQALDSQIVLSDSELRRQADRLEWSRQMFKNKYVSEGEVNSDTDRLLRSEVSLKYFRGQKELLKNHTSPVNIRRLQIAVDQAKSVEAYLDLRLKLTEERLRKYQRQVELCTIRAPHDGFVIYANDNRWGYKVEVGLRVYQRMKLMYLPDLSMMEVQAELNETVSDRVHENMNARVTIESMPGVSLEGHVVSVSPVPMMRRDIASLLGISDVRSYKGVIRLHSAPPGLLPGMSAEVDILTAHHEGQLVVPKASVLGEVGQKYCFVAGPGGLERREIELGEGTRDLVEVRSGLDEGEEVLREPSRLDPGEIEQASVPASAR